MSRLAEGWAPLALVLVFLSAGCRVSVPSTTIPASTASTGETGSTRLPTTSAAYGATAAAPVDRAEEECDSFTIALDRFVFIRLQPIVEQATDLLHSTPESADPDEVVTGLTDASRQLLRLVDELDLMGVPPREIVDLLLSIREGTLLFVTGFEKGAKGWSESNADTITEAKDAVREASAVLTEFFGWQLCG
ncbi:MAG: hypothetical protein OXD34_06055 [bacterium]|nr:hypothetical protein [bacterium]